MMNIDQTELDKFSEIAHEWWNKEGASGPLHAINPLRLEFIQQDCSLENKKVLDVGCGGGILTEALAAAKAKTYGIDASKDLIQVAKLHLDESQLTIHYQQTTAETYSAKHKAQFDIVTCMELLEHVPDPESIVQACAELVKPNGHLFISTINRNPKSYLQAVIAAEYILQLLPKGTHDYQKFIKPSELEQWARNNKLQLNNITGMSYNPLSKKYYLTDDIQVNYIAHFTKS